MIITAVGRSHRRGARSRLDVYIDGVVAFDVSRETASALSIAPGRIVTEPEIAAIIGRDARRAAMNAAVAMLARRPHSEREVRRRLAQRKTSAGVIDETVARLRDARLLDDAEFARSWTESRDRTSPRGRRLLVRELRAAGVDADIATDAAATVSDGDAAYRFAQRRLRSLASLEYEAFRARLGGQLQRRGFGWETARTTVDRCWRELGGDAEADETA